MEPVNNPLLSPVVILGAGRSGRLETYPSTVTKGRVPVNGFRRSPRSNLHDTVFRSTALKASEDASSC